MAAGIRAVCFPSPYSNRRTPALTRTRAALAAAVALLAAPVRAADEAALWAAAEVYVRHPVVQCTIDRMWSGKTMRAMLTAIARAQCLALRPGQTETLTPILGEEFAPIRPLSSACGATAAEPKPRPRRRSHSTPPGPAPERRPGRVRRCGPSMPAPRWPRVYLWRKVMRPRLRS